MTDDFEVSRRAEMLRSSDSRERYSALLDISLMVASERRHARPAIPLVLRATGDSNPRVRAQALITLSDLAGHAKALDLDSSVYALARRITLEHLDDPSDEVRAAAVGSLGRLGPLESGTFPALVRLAREPEPMLTRASALTQLGRFDTSNRGAQIAILGAIHDSEPFVRASAVQSLGTWVPSDRTSAQVALTLLDDPDNTVRYAAYEALRSLATPQAELLSTFETLLAGDDAIKAQVAAELTGRMGSRARSLARSLWNAYQRFQTAETSTVFITALAVVAPEGQESDAAIRMLTETLSSNRPRRQARAAEVLGTFGAHASSAVPALSQAARSDDAAVSQAAREALKRISESHTNGNQPRVPPV